MLEKIGNSQIRLAVIGLGYVGLPLALEFGKIFHTVGFDVKEERLERLRRGEDTTLECTQEELKKARFLSYSSNPEDLADTDIFIVTVPTPVDQYNRPDLGNLIRGSQTVGSFLKKGSVVIYESTVYPGCTEEVCVPVLEQYSHLKFNEDFFCGYSPERINPGDKAHTLLNTVKITSGSNAYAAQVVNTLYRSILKDNTCAVSSIKVAEAAKVIENSQRDLNIAFVNELAKIFHLIGIDTNEVLSAAGTKWNFLKFQPGLVGGHCIGVDPYYLTHKAQSLGYLPEVILAGRRINDGMGRYVADEVIKLMIRKGKTILNARVLQLGITFKENCCDIRNSRAVDVVRRLEEFGCQVDIADPWADPEEVRKAYSFQAYKNMDALDMTRYDAVILAVAHRQFTALQLNGLRRKGIVVYDIKGCLPREDVDARL